MEFGLLFCIIDARRAMQPWQIHGCLYSRMTGTITALVVQKRNKNRVNVYLDGEFAFGLAAIQAMKLRKGQVLSDADIAQLKTLDEVERAYERALKLLAYRPRSIEEVRQHLRAARFSEEPIETAIERLTQAGLLDDLAFARYWVENRERFSPRGVRALRYELRQKGLSDAVISDALSRLDEEALAHQAACTRLRRLKRADPEIRRKRLEDFLLRRGFAYEIVRDVLDHLWDEFCQEWEMIEDSEE